MNDLVKELRFLVDLNSPEHGGPYRGAAATRCVESMAAAANEIDRLRAELLKANAEQERLENQLASVRSELVATCARIEAWEDVIEDARNNLSAHLPFDVPS